MNLTIANIYYYLLLVFIYKSLFLLFRIDVFSLYVLLYSFELNQIRCVFLKCMNSTFLFFSLVGFVILNRQYNGSDLDKIKERFDFLNSKGFFSNLLGQSKVIVKSQRMKEQWQWQ